VRQLNVPRRRRSGPDGLANPIVVRNRNFGLMWASQIQSDLGTWLMVIAVPIYVFSLTDSPISTSLAFIAEALPALFLAPFAGVLVDRWDRRLVMVGSDAVRAVCVLCMLFGANVKLVWVIYVATFAENSVAQFFDPAYSALIPTITGRGKDLDDANGWSAASSGAVRLVGGPLGGLLYGLCGFHWLVGLDSATYVVSALLVLSIRVAPGDAVEVEQRRFFAELGDGVTFLRRNQILRSLLVVSSLFLFANGALSIIVVPFVVHVLQRGAQEVGILMAGLGVGYLFGSYLGRFFSRRDSLRFGIVICLIAITCAFGGLFNTGSFAMALVFIAFLGAPGAALLLLVRVWIQRTTADRMLGRVTSAFTATHMAATVAGAASGGVLASAIGIVPMANLALVPMTVATATALMIVPARAKSAEHVAL